MKTNPKNESKRILFSLGTLIVFLVLGLMGTELYPSLNFIHKDTKFPWIREVLFNRRPQEIDVAFVGSSRTMTGVKAALIGKELGGNRTVYNFARNWTGRELDYLIAKHLLLNHQVKHLVLDTDLTFFEHKHKLSRFSFAASDQWLELRRITKAHSLTDFLFLDKALVIDLKDLIGWSAQSTVRAVINPIYAWLNKDFEREIVEMNDETHGFFIEDANLKTRVPKEFQWNPTDMLELSDKGLEVSRGAQFYLSRIMCLAKEKGVRVSFLYLPAIGSPLMSPTTYRYYRQWGEVLFPDVERVFTKNEHWWDFSHLFQKGATALSLDIARLLKNGAQASKVHSKYESLFQGG